MKEEPHLVLQLQLQRRWHPMIEDMEETPRLTRRSDLTEGFGPQRRRFRHCPASRSGPLIGDGKERGDVDDRRDELRDIGRTGSYGGGRGCRYMGRMG